MDYQEIIYYQEVDAEIEKLKNIADTLGKKVSTDSMRPHQLSVFIDLDKYFRAIIFFNFSLRCSIPMAYYLAFQQRRNADGLYGTIYPKRHLVPEQVFNLGRYHYGHYDITQGSCISEAGKTVIEMVINLTPALLTMCRKSTPWYNEERMNETLHEWHTEARLFGISKEMPIQRMVTGIKASHQASYDSCYGMHGSNGTYVENANPEWVLHFKLSRLAFELDESCHDRINIHQYITQKMRPRLGWGKITSARLEQLNGTLKKLTLKVVTREMEKAPCYRNFVPAEYASWDDALDSIFSQLQ